MASRQDQLLEEFEEFEADLEVEHILKKVKTDCVLDQGVTSFGVKLKEREGLQSVLPGGRKRLKQHVAHPQLISGVLERHNVMRIAGNAFGIFAHRKHVLAQVKHRDVLMMRMFGE